MTEKRQWQEQNANSGSSAFLLLATFCANYNHKRPALYAQARPKLRVVGASPRPVNWLLPLFHRSSTKLALFSSSRFFRSVIPSIEEVRRPLSAARDVYLVRAHARMHARTHARAHAAVCASRWPIFSKEPVTYQKCFFFFFVVVTWPSTFFPTHTCICHFSPTG